MSPPLWVRFTDQAQLDLDAIRLHGINTWGPESAEQYAQRIRQTINRLAQYPESAELYPNDPETLRRALSGHHLIFYVIRPHELVVIRIFHERQKPSFTDS